MLGLGLGLNKGSYIKPLPKYLTDAGCTFAINVDRQVKALANPNSPFINPLVDVVGKLGKNLFDLMNPNTAAFPSAVDLIRITEGFKVKNTTVADFRRIRFTVQLKPLTTYTLKATVAVISGENAIQVRVFNGGSVLASGTTQVTFTTDSVGLMWLDFFCTFSTAALGEVNYTNVMLNEGATPLTYEPYGFNNVLLQSFAGTTADGYTQIALPNGKNPWFVNSDGTDSYMIGVNNADTDILGTVNFGLGFYTRTNGTLVNSWLISKAESSEATTQYGVKITSTGGLQLFLNGTAITLATGLVINTPYKIVIVREAGTLKCEVNDVETYSAAETTSLTTRPNLRLGARSSNVGGTTHTEFYNGYFGAFDLSQGSLCTLASFKKSFAKLIGGTYV